MSTNDIKGLFEVVNQRLDDIREYRIENGLHLEDAIVMSCIISDKNDERRHILIRCDLTNSTKVFTIENQGHKREGVSEWDVYDMFDILIEKYTIVTSSSPALNQL